MLPPDLHIHTQYCGHGEGSVIDMAKGAMNKGFHMIGIAEHFPYPPRFEEPYPDCVVPRDLFKTYWDEFQETRQMHSDKLKILAGIEVDFLPDYTEIQKEELAEYSFDYFIGSLHILDHFIIDATEDLAQEALNHYGSESGIWNKYWDSILAMLDTDICDIVGHLDMLKKFLPMNDYSPYMEKITHILERVKDENRAIDYNMGGIDRSLDKSPYPSQAILDRAAEIGVDISLGSDAHAPDQIGRYFSLAIEKLKSMGWKEVVYFEKREKKYYKL